MRALRDRGRHDIIGADDDGWTHEDRDCDFAQSVVCEREGTGGIGDGHEHAADADQPKQRPAMRQQVETDQTAGDCRQDGAGAYDRRFEDLMLDGHALPGLFELVGAAAIIGVFVDQVGGALQEERPNQRHQEGARFKYAVIKGDDTGQAHRHISSGEDARAQRLIPGAHFGLGRAGSQERDLSVDRCRFTQ